MGLSFSKAMLINPQYMTMPNTEINHPICPLNEILVSLDGMHAYLTHEILLPCFQNLITIKSPIKARTSGETKASIRRRGWL